MEPLAKRGRRLNQKINARDERGWRIPREGTTRRLVYDRLVAGQKVVPIAEALGLSKQAVTMHKREIVRADHCNALRYAASKADAVADR